jgi:hypothetical protein
MIVELLLVVGATATGVCFVKGHRMLGVVGVLAGLATFGIYLVVGTVLESAVPGLAAGFVYAAGMGVVAVTRPSRHAGAPASPVGTGRGRRALVGGLVGMVPGALVLVVPLLLNTLGVITSDESQVGFLGIFLIPAGLVAGGLVGALTTSRGATQDSPADSHS